MVNGTAHNDPLSVVCWLPAPHAQKPRLCCVSAAGRRGKRGWMNRVLVTGGCGFIGSHLVESLLATGAEVMVIDDFRVATRERLAQAGAGGGLTVIEGDVRNLGALPPLAGFAPDAVFHMAALHFIPYCSAHPQEALDVNVVGLGTLLRALRGAPLKTLVFPSSGAVYGFGADPWPEAAPARPREMYGLSKWLGEQIVMGFHQDRPEVRTVVARLFNTYGPRETNPHVLPGIVAALSEGKPVEVGSLWPKRDLIFVTDVVAGLLAAAAGGPGFEIFNVGTGTGTTIGQVIRAIEVITGSPVEARQVPARMREDDGHLISDPAKLRRATGWYPRYDLWAGLRRLLELEGLL
jgi:UDP-glucose 4-epimerase